MKYVDDKKERKRIYNALHRFIIYTNDGKKNFGNVPITKYYRFRQHSRRRSSVWSIYEVDDIRNNIRYKVIVAFRTSAHKEPIHYIIYK